VGEIGRRTLLRTMAEPVALRAFHPQIMERKPVEIVKNR